MALALILILAIAYWFIYHWIDHTECENPGQLKRNAKLISCDVKKTSMKDKFKTVITFSDGFKYWTYKTGFEPHLGMATIFVDGEMKQQAIQKAIDAHTKVCDKYKVFDTVPTPSEELLEAVQNEIDRQSATPDKVHDYLNVIKATQTRSQEKTVDYTASSVPGKTFNSAFSCSVLKELFYSDIVFAENILESQSISKLISVSLWVCDTKMRLNVPEEYRHLKKHFINNGDDNISGIIIELPDAKAECDCNYVALVVSDGEKEYYTSEYYKSADAFGLCFFDENNEHYALDANVESLEDFKKKVFKC